MKIKTSELSGTALCYTVCIIEKPQLTWGETIGIHHASRQIVVPSMPSPQCYSPYMNWASFGPIIERELITISQGRDLITSIWTEGYGPGDGGYKFKHTGPTPLIAAMRTFVASRLGDEVDVPEELAP